MGIQTLMNEENISVASTQHQSRESQAGAILERNETTPDLLLWAKCEKRFKKNW